MTSSRRKWLIPFIGIVLLIGSGCSAKSTPSPQRWTPTCADAIDGNLDKFSENDIEIILNESLESKQMAGCWVPLMQRCLDQDKEIPQNHLAQAINEFNQLDNMIYFEKSIFRYFSNIDKGVASYRTADKALLTGYCRYVVRNAKTSNDPAVRNAQLITRHLDPDLFDLMFR